MYVQEVLITYTITKKKKRKHNHGSNKLDNRHKKRDNGIVVTFPLLSKWTYKTAVAVAKESIDTNTFEIICVVETNKIMIKNDKETEKTE